jgi:hypothetical protein
MFNVGDDEDQIDQIIKEQVSIIEEGDLTGEIIAAIAKDAIREAIGKADVDLWERAVYCLNNAKKDISAYPESEAKTENINKLLEAIHGNSQAILRDQSQPKGRSFSSRP